MRRKDREIERLDEIWNIIKQCSVCNVAFFDKEYPYCIPVNFGVQYVDEKFVLYFHGASEGKKVLLMNENNKVGFSMNCATHLLIGEKDCQTTMEYESVCGNGVIEKVDNSEKETGLRILMQQYDKKEHYEFEENALKAVTIYKLSVHEIHGKKLKRCTI